MLIMTNSNNDILNYFTIKMRNKEETHNTNKICTNVLNTKKKELRITLNGEISMNKHIRGKQLTGSKTVNCIIE